MSEEVSHDPFGERHQHRPAGYTGKTGAAELCISPAPWDDGVKRGIIPSDRTGPPRFVSALVLLDIRQE